jgi:hypothetical protein
LDFTLIISEFASGLGYKLTTRASGSFSPEPIANSDIINVKSNQDVTAELISVLGQKMGGPFEIRKFTNVLLNLGHLHNGPYILRVVNSFGASNSKLLLIHR